MILSKEVPMLSEDAPAMHQVCCRIAAKRADERTVLPAPEGHERPSGLKRPGQDWGRVVDLLFLIGLLIALIRLLLLNRP